MKEQLKIAVAKGVYASPRAALVELEPTTNILICSVDSGGGSGTEPIGDGGEFTLE